jgi:hypothetical protein
VPLVTASRSTNEKLSGLSAFIPMIAMEPGPRAMSQISQIGANVLAKRHAAKKGERGTRADQSS